MAGENKSFTYTPDNVWHEFLRISEGKKGIFIGEWHGLPHAVDFIAAHLSELKARGFTKIFIELDPYATKALAGGLLCSKDLKQAHGVTGLDSYAMVSSQMMLMPLYALPHGIEVMGHDDVTDATRMSEEKIARNAYTPEAMDRRNRFAEQYIKASTKANDRYIIIGGANHSGKEGGRLPNGQTVKGLDELLDIPSMDFYYMPLEQPKWYSGLAELAGRKIDQWMGKKPSSGPIDIKSGGDAATTIITATKIFSFDENVSLSKEALQKALGEARAKGDCGYQPKLGTKEVLDQTDIPATLPGQKAPSVKSPSKKNTERLV